MSSPTESPASPPSHQQTPSEEYLACMAAGTQPSKEAAAYAERCTINPIPPRQVAELPLCHSASSSSGSSSALAPGSVTVHYLADRMDLQPTVARAQFAEWADVYIESFGIPTAEANVLHHAENYCKRDQLNTTLVFLVDGQLAATAMLLTEDVLLGQPYFGTTPWLTCVFVFEAFRGRGLLPIVVDSVAALCQAWGYHHVWLITQHLQQVYQKLGFRSIETVETYRHYYTVMRRDFGREAQPKLTEQDAKDAHKQLHPERY